MLRRENIYIQVIKQNKWNKTLIRESGKGYIEDLCTIHVNVQCEII